MTGIRVIGVDPGITGAFALCVDGQIIDVRDMPIIADIVSGKTRNRPNPALMVALIAEWQKDGPLSVYVEKVGVTPKDGAVGAFAFGKGAGMIEGCLAGLGVPYTLVIPQTWKKVLAVPADKNAARARACQLFPAMASKFSRVRDDGRSEASLISFFGYRDLVGMLA